MGGGGLFGTSPSIAFTGVLLSPTIRIKFVILAMHTLSSLATYNLLSIAFETFKQASWLSFLYGFNIGRPSPAGGPLWGPAGPLPPSPPPIE